MKMVCWTSLKNQHEGITSPQNAQKLCPVLKSYLLNLLLPYPVYTKAITPHLASRKPLLPTTFWKHLCSCLGLWFWRQTAALDNAEEGLWHSPSAKVTWLALGRVAMLNVVLPVHLPSKFPPSTSSIFKEEKAQKDLLPTHCPKVSGAELIPSH